MLAKNQLRLNPDRITTIQSTNTSQNLVSMRALINNHSTDVNAGGYNLGLQLSDQQKNTKIRLHEYYTTL
jgi:hypothetical protein